MSLPWCSDGYTVVYALADFDPSITNSAIILADKRDGKLLDRDEKPLRILVPQDKRPARSVRLVEEIEVIHRAKQVESPARTSTHVCPLRYGEGHKEVLVTSQER
jgi:hypothetical protein